MARLLLRHRKDFFAWGVSMKHVVLPLTWFVVLSCIVALASGLSLSLV